MPAAGIEISRCRLPKAENSNQTNYFIFLMAMPVPDKKQATTNVSSHYEEKSCNIFYGHRAHIGLFVQKQERYVY